MIVQHCSKVIIPIRNHLSRETATIDDRPCILLFTNMCPEASKHIAIKNKHIPVVLTSRNEQWGDINWCFHFTLIVFLGWVKLCWELRQKTLCFNKTIKKLLFPTLRCATNQTQEGGCINRGPICTNPHRAERTTNQPQIIESPLWVSVRMFIHGLDIKSKFRI